MKGRRQAALAVAVVAAVSGSMAASGPAPAAGRTVVSMTFDDGHVSHPTVGAQLQRHGMAGTFYVNSGKVGTSPTYHMTWADIDLLADAHEVGGHTIDHSRLPRLSTAEARRQICDDRAALAAYEPGISSFAYPYGDLSPAVKDLVGACGYTSGRALGGVKAGTVCRSCPLAEALPPKDPYALRTPRYLTPTTSLAELKGYVTQAQAAGGWVILLFHGVCDDRCTGGYSFSATSFAQFLEWLEAEKDAGRVEVKTVGEVMAAG